MGEDRPKLWEDDPTNMPKPRKFHFRSAAIHYLGLVIAIAGLAMAIYGYFNPVPLGRVLVPGDSPNWEGFWLGLALLLGGGAAFLFIDE